MLRRRAMLGGQKEQTIPLLQQGSKTFNSIKVTITDRIVNCERPKNTGTDAYDVKRYFNITDFTANVTTGTDNTADISNKNTGKIIPAGSTCVFSASDTSGKTSAGYDYVAVLLRNTTNGNIKRIGLYGQNVPSKSASWTQSTDVEIGCIALELSHTYPQNYFIGTISLTVNGEEWL